MRSTSGSLREWLGDRLWSFELSDRNELEERVASWIATEQSTSWIIPALVLGTSFAAMVLFAISR